MGVDADAGRHREITGGGLAMKIFVLDAAEREAADAALDGGARGITGARREGEIVGERVGGAEGKDGERDGSASQFLNDVVNGAIAAAGEDGVAAARHRIARVDGGLVAGTANGKLGMDSSGLDDADGNVELAVATLASAAGIGIKENGGFAHAPRLASFEFSA